MNLLSFAALQRRLCLGLLLISAAPAVAQPQSEPPVQGYPPESLKPDADAAELFAVLTQPGMDPRQAAAAVGEASGALRGYLQPVLDNALRRGERASHSESQVDLLTLFAAQGDRARPLVLTAQLPTGTTMLLPHQTDASALLPPGWLPMVQIGALPASGGPTWVEISRLSPKVVLVTKSIFLRRGSATCPQHEENVFYSVPDVQASEADMMALIVTAASAERIRHVCRRLERVSATEYSMRYFDAEDYRLEGLEFPHSRYRLVPSSRFDGLEDAARTAPSPEEGE